MTQLAIKGGEKTCQGGFHPWPHFDERELRYVEEVIRSRRWFSGMRGADPGSRTEAFETAFARAHDARFGVACANGTVALEIALRAAGIGAGDEVIVPGVTFIATLSAVLQVNAIPIVVDCLYDTQCIDPAAVEQAVNQRTRAIIPVHFGGFAADMERLNAIARRHQLIVIEDAAHAHGAIYRGRKVGSLGHMATFSFQESKTMTAGEGGLITSNDADLAEKCIQYRSCGRHADESWYVHYVMPVNYRLSELQSAVLCAQLERLEEQVETKNRNARFLGDQLAEISGIRPLPGDGQTDRNGYYLYLLQYEAAAFAGVGRDRFVEALGAEGIPCHIGYPWPLTRNPIFAAIESGAKGCPFTCPYYGRDVRIAKTSLPVSERICRETVVIPHQVLLSPPSELENIPRAIRKIQRHAADLLH